MSFVRPAPRVRSLLMAVLPGALALVAIMVALRTELGHGRVYRAAPGEVALFAVTADGDLRVASPGTAPPVKAGDRVITLVGAG